MSSLHARPAPPSDDPTAPVAALFDAHCGFVCRVLRHHGVHEASLDDAVQDVFVTAHRRWSSFEGRSSARSWLYGIARRIASRYRRSAQTRARHHAEAPGGVAEGVDDPMARVQAVHSLGSLLERIDRDKRAVFLLHEVEGMTAPEVADALGIPVGTVYSRLRAAWHGLGQQAEREQIRLRRSLPGMRAPGPDARQQRRIWGLVAGAIDSGAAGGIGGAAAGATAGIGSTAGTTTGIGTTAGWVAQIKWVVVGAALGAGLIGARAAVVAGARGGDGHGASRTVERQQGERASAGAIETSAGSPGRPRTAGIQQQDVPARGDAPAAGEAMREPPRIGPSTGRVRDRVDAKAPHTATTASEADALAAELSLLQRAQQAAGDGRTSDALELLDEHAQRFPRGQLVQERRLARVRVLCATGRTQQARREAAAAGLDPQVVCP